MDGSFSPEPESIEADLRFVYTACTISTLLNDFSGINCEKIIDFI